MPHVLDLAGQGGNTHQGQSYSITMEFCTAKSGGDEIEKLPEPNKAQIIASQQPKLEAICAELCKSQDAALKALRDYNNETRLMIDAALS